MSRPPQTSTISIHRHHAMATAFEVRIAHEDTSYAAQAAHAAFSVADRLESLLSRFDPHSEITALAALTPGQSLQLSEPTFACLTLSREMEQLSVGAFSLSATARRAGCPAAEWTLHPDLLSFTLISGQCLFDLGAIGKGFALDRMAEELREWGCSCFLLVAGGSSVLAGEAPPSTVGWTARLDGLASSGQPESTTTLAHCALGSSGTTLQGRHITDPRTGLPATRRQRVWLQAPTAAEADALSTALMILDEREITALALRRPDLRMWLLPS